MKGGGIIRHRDEKRPASSVRSGAVPAEAVAEGGTDRHLAQELGVGYGHIQTSGTHQPLGVIDVVGRLADAALGVVDGLAEAVVEALAVQVALAAVITGREAGIADPEMRVRICRCKKG